MHSLKSNIIIAIVASIAAAFGIASDISANNTGNTDNTTFVAQIKTVKSSSKIIVPADFNQTPGNKVPLKATVSQIRYVKKQLAADANTSFQITISRDNVIQHIIVHTKHPHLLWYILLIVGSGVIIIALIVAYKHHHIKYI